DFRTGGQDHFLRIDADLPVYDNGGLPYAKLGRQNSLWVPLLEKAWTFYRPKSWGADVYLRMGTYGMIWGGGPNELWNALNDPFKYSGVDSTLSDWLAGKEVVVRSKATVTDPTVFVTTHYYFVESTNYVDSPWGFPLIRSFTLRNPYGGDP